MNKRLPHGTMPFTCTTTTGEVDSCSYYDVVFHNDFGYIKSGEHFDEIIIDYESGVMYLYTCKNDTPDETIKFSYMPIHTLRSRSI